MLLFYYAAIMRKKKTKNKKIKNPNLSKPKRKVVAKTYPI